jgi:hypothetical protein
MPEAFPVSHEQPVTSRFSSFRRPERACGKAAATPDRLDAILSGMARGGQAGSRISAAQALELLVPFLLPRGASLVLPALLLFDTIPP